MVNWTDFVLGAEREAQRKRKKGFRLFFIPMRTMILIRKLYYRLTELEAEVRKLEKRLEPTKGYHVMKEGMVKKGGVNTRPTTPPPPPPKGQGGSRIIKPPTSALPPPPPPDDEDE